MVQGFKHHRVTIYVFLVNFFIESKNMGIAATIKGRRSMKCKDQKTLNIIYKLQ